MGNPTIFLGFDSSVKARNVNLGALPSAVAQQVRRMRPADAPNTQWPECGPPRNAGSYRRLRHPLVVAPPRKRYAE